jgi:hypothetical protein
MTTWILSVCFGVTFAMCNTERQYEYPNQQDCYKARESVLPQVGKGFAVCFPKKEKQP